MRRQDFLVEKRGQPTSETGSNRKLDTVKNVTYRLHGAQA
jgi:hypothetical protein